MSPESVTPDAIRRALDAVRPPAQELDDASIACILDHGLEALPSDARALAIRAIATNPAVAAIVVALHEPDAARMALRDLRATQAWRFAFAACTLLASGTTLWML
ncbi:MAG: hypothetical protein KGR22_11410, partial [Planctomycetes bacterium]|nr:hypothetical protein [Planctomycetota bacterium]